MKIEYRLFTWGTPLFVIVAIVYGFITDWSEPVGVVGLFLTAGLVILIGGYLAFTARHIDPRPEDDDNGLIEQGAGELGVFAPYSWWPIALAGSAALVFAGAAVGWWLVYIGLAVSSLAVVGWVYEFYRGEHAH